MREPIFAQLYLPEDMPRSLGAVRHVIHVISFELLQLRDPLRGEREVTIDATDRGVAAIADQARTAVNRPIQRAGRSRKLSLDRDRGAADPRICSKLGLVASA
ncbi:MAG: hypothetical protein AB7P03_05390 [Kofleriaceae bacterium]